MSRSILLFLLIFTGLVSEAQDTLNITDTKGLKQGPWRKLDKNNQKIYEGQFRDGVPCGEFRYYYPDGRLKTISVFSDGGKVSRTVSYSSNGRKIAEGKYVNEKKDSIWRYFSDFDGILLSEDCYSAGLKNGLSKTFYPNGKLSEQLTYKSGKKEGDCLQYFEDGKLKLKGYYLNDEKEGLITAYYPNGQPSFSGKYQFGHKEGTWLFYDEKGKVTKMLNYAGGILVKEPKK